MTAISPTSEFRRINVALLVHAAVSHVGEEKKKNQGLNGGKQCMTDQRSIFTIFPSPHPREVALSSWGRGSVVFLISPG